MLIICQFKDLKNENSKLQLKLTEQSNRYKELKLKQDELYKLAENKVNELLIIFKILKNKIILFDLII